MQGTITARERFKLRGRGGLLAVLGLLAALLLFGSIFYDRFRSVNNYTNILEQSTGLALVSLGQTFAILTGGIDLSVGSLISLTSTLTSGLINGDPARILPVVIGVLLLGLLVGLINGLLMIWLKVHPLIVTLGTGALLQGTVLLYSLGPAGSTPLGFDYIAYGRLAGIPVGGMITVLIFILAALFLHYTRLGRTIYAVGGDPDAATLIGIRKNAVLLFVYALCGFCAALTGIYLVARFGVGQPYTGANYTLASITPVIVGGTLLSGGRGGVLGTLFGVYLINALNNLLNFMGVSSHIQLVAQGLIVIIAVSVYVERRKAL